MCPGHTKPAQPPATSRQDITRPVPGPGDVPRGQRRVDNDINQPAEDDGRPACAAEHRVRTPGVRERGDNLHGVRRRGVDVDLRDGVDGVLRVLEPQLEGRLTERGARVVEEHVQQRQRVDVPGAEDTAELGRVVRGARRAAFELHARVGERDVARFEVERARDLRDVGDEEEAGEGDG